MDIPNLRKSRTKWSAQIKSHSHKIQSGPGLTGNSYNMERSIAYTETTARKGGAFLEVIIHLPKNRQDQQELEKRIATIHAQAVLENVRRQTCPLDQKLALIKAVQKSFSINKMNFT